MGYKSKACTMLMKMVEIFSVLLLRHCALLDTLSISGFGDPGVDSECGGGGVVGWEEANTLYACITAARYIACFGACHFIYLLFFPIFLNFILSLILKHSL